MTYTVDGVPQYGAPLTNDSVFAIAVTHFDSALTLASGTDAKSVPGASRRRSIAKARALVEPRAVRRRGRTRAGVAVATSFQYLLTFDQTTGDNNIWSLNNSAGRYSVSDSVDNITGLDPECAAVLLGQRSARPDDGAGVAKAVRRRARRCGAADLAGPQRRRAARVGNRRAVDRSGSEAAGRRLRGDDDDPQCAAHERRRRSALQGSPRCRRSQRRRPARPTPCRSISENAFWTFGRGQRLPSMRREIRQYGLTQDQVFPTGAFHKGGNFGADVNLPVPDAELTNPQFKGCIDRKA